MQYPKSLEALIEAFARYPGVGRKTAERYAMHTLTRLTKQDVDQFSEALVQAISAIKPCPVCHHLTDLEQCEICADTHRDSSRIMVVENSKDVFSIEKSGTYKGKYHVLGGALSPIQGVGPEELNLSTLWQRVAEGEVKEVILATSATQEGETTALYLKRILSSTDLLVTRIGYGVPVGANLEYADDQTLSKAIENRRVF